MQQVLNGVAVGSVYALFSLGFTLVFGLHRILNLAHGAVFMWGALIGLYATIAGAPLYLAFTLALLTGGALGSILEMCIFRPLRRREGTEFSGIVASIGAALILMSIAQQITDTQVLRYPVGAFPIIVYRFWGLRLSLLQIVMMASVVGLVLLLLYTVYRTSFGRQMRAVAVNERTARLLGIDPNLVYLKTFFISGALAGAAGMMIGIAFNSVNFLMGEPYMLRALVIIVLGGLGSIPGAVIAGLLLGLIQTFIVVTPYSGLTDAIIFGLLLIMLLIRPNGLFGPRQRDLGGVGR